MGPFPTTANGNRYILVASDYFTKWVEAYAIPNQEATTIAGKLVDNMFCDFGLPEQLHSDMGAQFESRMVKKMCNMLHINKTHTTPYHPQGDGIVERANCTIQNMLTTVTNSHYNDLGKLFTKSMSCIQYQQTCIHRLHSILFNVWLSATYATGCHLWSCTNPNSRTLSVCCQLITWHAKRCRQLLTGKRRIMTTRYMVISLLQVNLCDCVIQLSLKGIQRSYIVHGLVHTRWSSVYQIVYIK